MKSIDPEVRALEEELRQEVLLSGNTLGKASRAHAWRAWRILKKIVTLESGQEDALDPEIPVTHDDLKPDEEG